jgi:hypothetical protein
VKSKAGQALGSMSVRVTITPFLHQKSPSIQHRGVMVKYLRRQLSIYNIG